MVNIFINWFGPIVYNTDVFPCFALDDNAGAKCRAELDIDYCTNTFASPHFFKTKLPQVKQYVPVYKNHLKINVPGVCKRG